MPKIRKGKREKIGAECDGLGACIEQHSAFEEFPCDLLQRAKPLEVAAANRGARFDLNSDQTPGCIFQDNVYFLPGFLHAEHDRCYIPAIRDVPDRGV